MKRQLGILLILLLVNAFLAFVTYALLPIEQLTSGMSMTPEMSDIPLWLLGLANAAIILVLYGLLGLAGLFFARKLGLPGIFREDAGWRNWVVLPLGLGGLIGILITVIDRLFASLGEWPGFLHPPFPLSVVASMTAGIGEEILFRLFVMGLWAFLLNLILRRWKATQAALWAANLIAALVFAAAHLPATMLIAGVETPADLPPLVLVELFLLNGLLGLAAGERYIKDGLVAAAGVHFWADIVWHVLLPAFL